MDVLTSTEFRKCYASLTEPTEVTVNGHVIGRWVPVNAPIRQLQAVRPIPDEDVVDFGLGTPEQQTAAAGRLALGEAGVTIIEPRFNSRPFTPAPKIRDK